MTALLVTVLLAAAIGGWYWLHRRMQGEDGPLMRLGKQGKDRLAAAAEMEAFIAAYRAGKISPAELKSDATAGGAGEPRQEGGGPAPTPANDPLPAPRQPAAPAAVLRPEVKLGYLVFRAGLPDHHVFPNLRLADLGVVYGNGKIDLLICDAQFKPVAAVDLVASATTADAGKTAAFDAAGIRYLLVTLTRLPRPAQVRKFVYPHLRG